LPLKIQWDQIKLNEDLSNVQLSQSAYTSLKPIAANSVVYLEKRSIDGSSNSSLYSTNSQILSQGRKPRVQ